MSRRREKRPSHKYLIGCWAAALVSLLLLLPTGAALGADFGSFRSCNVNSSGLFVDSCGKRSLNMGDVVIVLLFLGALAVVVCLFTHAWRTTRRGTS